MNRESSERKGERPDSEKNVDDHCGTRIAETTSSLPAPGAEIRAVSREAGACAIAEQPLVFADRGKRQLSNSRPATSPTYRPFFRSILRASIPSLPLSHYRSSSPFPPSASHRYLSLSLSLAGTDPPRNNNREANSVQPALAHGAPLCQEASQGGMAFFVTSNEESGKAGRVLRAPALFLLALIGGGDAATAARCLSPPPPPSPPTASSPSAAAGAFRRDARPSPFERHDASRDPRDADHRKSCAFRPHSAPSLRFFYRSPLPLPLPRQRYNQGVSMYPIYRRATLPAPPPSQIVSTHGVPTPLGATVGITPTLGVPR